MEYFNILFKNNIKISELMTIFLIIKILNISHTLNLNI